MLFVLSVSVFEQRERQHQREGIDFALLHSNLFFAGSRQKQQLRADKRPPLLLPMQ
jgi:hypothetical protein